MLTGKSLDYVKFYLRLVKILSIETKISDQKSTSSKCILIEQLFPDKHLKQSFLDFLYNFFCII